MKPPKVIIRAKAATEERAKKLYTPMQLFFANHPGCAFFLSHGFFHSVIAIGLSILCVWLIKQTDVQKPEYKEVKISFSDLMEDSELPLEMNVNCSTYTKWFGPELFDFEKKYHTSQALTISAPFQGISVNTYNSELRTSGPWGLNSDKLYVDSLSNNYVKVHTATHKGPNTDLEIFGNFLSPDRKNPYYYFYIEFEFERDYNYHTSSIKEIASEGSIQGSVNINLSSHRRPNNSPLHIVNAAPINYTYTPNGGISFDIKDIINGGGVYILAEDINKKTKTDRDIFFYSIMLGAAIAFLLDVLVNLVIKWRNLAKRTKEPEHIKVKGFRSYK